MSFSMLKLKLCLFRQQQPMNEFSLKTKIVRTNYSPSSENPLTWSNCRIYRNVHSKTNHSFSSLLKTRQSSPQEITGANTDGKASNLVWSFFRGKAAPAKSTKKDRHSFLAVSSISLKPSKLNSLLGQRTLETCASTSLQSKWRRDPCLTLFHLPKSRGKWHPQAVTLLNALPCKRIGRFSWGMAAATHQVQLISLCFVIEPLARVCSTAIEWIRLRWLNQLKIKKSSTGMTLVSISMTTLQRKDRPSPTSWKSNC